MTVGLKLCLLLVAPPECVIVRKLESYRESGLDKHLHDIRSMLSVSGKRIDKAALDEWIRVRGVENEWQKVNA